MHVNLGPVTLSPGFSCDFPATLCPNCGTKSSLQAAVQTTKKTTAFFLLAGTELTFPFPLAVCHECMPTLERRPLSLMNKLFLTALVIGGVASFLLFALQTNQIHNALMQNHQANQLRGSTHRRIGCSALRCALALSHSIELPPQGLR
jgi:hypothetical protein